ncbi:HORMA domain-containing protein [Aspergillus karnatakaensis]|uniref:putative meiosis specific protein Hop1 n=1 Tax=Aspergillus karnatakaensis TaxID=1810916 RepID=UPI003CCE0C0E
MARTKDTGPLTTVRSPRARPVAISPSVRSTPASSPFESGSAIDGQSNMSAEEKLILQQQQSLELVKIMLHVSFGTLFYLREFLPLQCFEERDLRQAQRQQRLSYREFISNETDPRQPNGANDGTVGRAKKSQPLQVIVRGSDPKADLIVDVLETGIFDALSKSVLEAVQLTIVTDQSAPDNVLESYTFSFRYNDGLGDLPKRLESLSVQPCGYVADMKSAQTARVGLEMIIRRLIALSAFLPTLPNKRSLGVHLFYTDDCPSDYDPPGFNGSKDGTINYPLTEHWRRETQPCGKMESGFHTVGLKVTSLKWTGPEPEESEAIPPVPAEIEYKDVVPRAADIGLDDEESKRQSPPVQAGISQEATQDVIERERLQRMMPSQEVPYSDSDLVATQPAKSIPTETQKAEEPKLDQLFILRREKIADIRKTISSPAARNDRELPKPGSIACECGWNEEGEEIMIECQFCRSKQHMLCYGYVGEYECTGPDVHACYECLLQPSEEEIYMELAETVLARRVLQVVFDEGYPTSRGLLGEKIHQTGTIAAQVTKKLKEEGILKPTPGYRLKGFTSKGLPHFMLIDTEEVRERIQREIMHPLAKIDHHYTIQQPPNSLNALSPPAIAETDSISNPPSQRKSSRTRTNETTDQHTSDSQDKSTVTPYSTRRTTRQSLANAPTKDDDVPQLVTRAAASASSASASAAAAAAPKPIRKRTRSSRIGPEPVTPARSTTDPDHDNGRESEGPRRSGRKRRKIGNYAKLIDVGAESSGNE